MYNTIDLTLLVILAFSLLYGFYKGIITLSVPIIAIIATIIIGPVIYNHTSKYFDHSFILKIIVFLATYSISRIILSKVEKSFKKILKVIFLGWVDRVLGALFAISSICIIIYIVFNIALTFNNNININSKILNYMYITINDILRL